LNKSHFGEWNRPLKYKRMVERVIAVQLFDVWNTPPTKAYVHYYDADNGFDMSNPIKIYQRKNGTYYVQFEGYRFDIDVLLGNKEQFI